MFHRVPDRGNPRATGPASDRPCYGPAVRIQREPARLPPGTVACLGTFDGFHLGHQALFQRARALTEPPAPVAVVTFEPQPAEVLAPKRAPRRLQSPVQRERVAAALGIETLVLLEFDRTLAAYDPDRFVDEFIVRGLQPVGVVVGRDFRFGAGRAGDVNTLARHMETAGLPFIPLDHVETRPGRKLGSTAIRAALAEGDVGHAATMLGRPHTLAGRVTRGDGRGRTLGFPTANVDGDGGFIPAAGVYAAALTVWDSRSQHHGKCLPAVCNVGPRPTFDADTPAQARVEVHALDVNLGEDLYDRDVEVAFVARLRDARKFPDIAALTAQIGWDIANARPLLQPDALARIITPSS